MNSPKNNPNELHGNFKQYLLTKYKQPLKPKQENHSQSHNKFFGFLHKQKESHIPLRISSPIADRKNKKKEKQIKDHKYKEHHHRNTIWQSDKIAPLVQSKWIVEHIDYPNNANHTANDANINISKVQRNQNAQMPQYRRFGDTNILRNHKKPLLTKLINEIPTADNIYRYLQSKNATNIENGASVKPPSPSNAKDTGFSSMDGDQSSSTYLQFNSRQYVNVNQHQNRIRSNGIVASPASSPSNNRGMARPLNNKNSDRSSNVSSSNSNSSDINSLDSMEHEIIHSKNNNSQSDSYLGPFNFRQLLRPTQGPTDSLRKRKGINLSLTPPPLQKGKV